MLIAIVKLIFTYVKTNNIYIEYINALEMRSHIRDISFLLGQF